MSQRLKPEVQDKLIVAATEEFAAVGFAKATVGAIAKRAKLSTGNVYRYFENKTALYEAVIDDAFVETFERLLAARVGSLTELNNLRELDHNARARQDELLSFWIKERLRVVTILDRAQGTHHADFGQQFVEQLTRLTLKDMKAKYGNSVGPQTSFLLTQIFDNTRRTIVAMLENYSDGAQIRSAFAAFWAFQLGGLARLVGFTKETAND